MLLRWISAAQTGRRHGHTYDVRRSPTAKTHLNETFSLDFPQSSVTGIVVSDNLALGNGSLASKNFTFGVAYQASAGIKDQPFDGILGLGFKNPNTNRKLVAYIRQGCP